ncbi:MAG: DUF1028 domain-containing protein [Methylophilaceae bacterium]|jgi:uncharacterized Ntn-hydrolase superfamily protein
MTFSIIARNPKTGEIGAAAATGNLCVGGWVLRGDQHKGITASQGFFPSTIWGEQILKCLDKFLLSSAINKIIKKDKNKSYRQIACMNLHGQGFAFTGVKNTKYFDQIILPNLVVSGNMLANDQVVKKIAENFRLNQKSLAQSLLSALAIGKKYGSDRRGLMSAAILVFKKDSPPLNIRVDYDKNPLAKLKKILIMTEKTKYKQWLKKLPTDINPYK